MNINAKDAVAVGKVGELAGETPLTSVQFLEGERRGRDRADKAEYKVKLSCAFCFSSAVSRIEYYHNSSCPSCRNHPSVPERY